LRIAGSVQAVTFDAGDTLVRSLDKELRRASRRAVRRWLRHRRVQRERYEPVFAAAGRRWVGSLEAGRWRAALEATEVVVRGLGLSLSCRERDELRGLVAELYDLPRYEAAEGVVDALAQMSRRGVRLGIVSDRPLFLPGRLLVPELEKLGIMRFFDPAAIAWSDEVGVRKPDRRLFLASLWALRVTPDRAAHVGDKKLRDVLGARQLAMTTIRYTRMRDDDGDGPEADAVIHDYGELAGAIGLA
jgi:FMN phosphatase YigB (HAD superfamily)